MASAAFSAWCQACSLLNAVAYIPIVAALERKGILARLASGDTIGRWDFDEAGLRGWGACHVAMKVFANQGWIIRNGIEIPSSATFEAGSRFSECLEIADACAEALSFYDPAIRLLQAGEGSSRVADLQPLSRVIAGLQTHRDEHWIATAVRAAVPATLLLALAARGLADAEPYREALDRLAGALGWGPDSRIFWETFLYPASYLPLLRSIPCLLEGQSVWSGGESGPVAESKIDRRIDIDFSARVFAASCKSAFLDLLIKVFELVPPEAQPRAIVDTGCGDGSMLASAWQAAVEGFPALAGSLLAVGVEFSPTAREKARQTLGSIPNHVIGGDIADPEEIVHTLEILGLPRESLLHISKSALHNRIYRRPPAPPTADWFPRRSAIACMAPDGEPISGEAIQWELTTVLRRWARVCGPHGMILIEPHTAPDGEAFRSRDRQFLSLLDALQGFSCQYPVEWNILQHALQSGGWTIESAKTLGEASLGYSHMSFSWVRSLSDGIDIPL